MLGDYFQLRIGVRRRDTSQHCLDQTLSHQIGKAAIRRSRMSVIVSGQSEMPLIGIAGPNQHILARTEKLNDRQRYIRIVDWISIFSIFEKRIQCH